MTTFEPITRYISGRGIIKIPEPGVDALRMLLYIDLVRRPFNEFVNYEWNPKRALFARMTFLSQGYVIRESLLQYEREVIELWEGQPSQLQISLNCATEAILQSFVNLSLAIPGTFPISKFNPIAEHPRNPNLIDEIRFSCYTSAALRLYLVAPSLGMCEAVASPPSPPPPPPPPPDVVFPPDTPFTGEDGTPVIDPPYDGNDDDGGTIPYPSDIPDEPPPQGVPCGEYTVVVGWGWSAGADPLSGQTPIPIYGEYGGSSFAVESASGTSRLILTVLCRGIRLPGFPGCGEYQNYSIDVVSATQPTELLNSSVVRVDGL